PPPRRWDALAIEPGGRLPLELLEPLRELDPRRGVEERDPRADQIESQRRDQEPQRAEDPRRRRDQDSPDAEITGQRGRVQGAGAAEGDERVAARIVA